MIAADDTVHPDVVVEKVPGFGVGDFVDVVVGRISADPQDLGASKALPVKPFRCKVVGKVGPKLIEKHIGIRGDENAFVKKDNRCR